MAQNIGDLSIAIKAVDEASTVLRSIQKEIKNTDKAAKSAKGTDVTNPSAISSMKNLLGILGGVTGGYLLLKQGLLDSVAAWNQHESVVAQTEAVLKSTAGVAGVTADAVADLATELQNTTIFEDEVVQKGENLLLTFTNIGKDTFPQATRTMLDMSQALGQDVSRSAIQLGKALQDPILGVTALRKVGVNFNAQQRETIKNLVETGKGLEAQKMILKELQVEFGGSAAKQLETFGGRMKWLRNQAGELQESLGKGITRGLVTSLVQGAGGITAFQSKMAGLQVYAAAFGAALVGSFAAVFRGLYNLVTMAAKAIAMPFQVAYGAAQDAVQTLNNALEGNFTISTENASAAMSSASSSITQDLTDISDGIDKAFDGVDAALADTGTASEAAIEPVSNFGAAVDDSADKAKEAAEKVESYIKKIKDLKKDMKDAVKSVKDDMAELKRSFKNDEKKASSDLGTNIASVIAAKQKEKADLEKEFAGETDGMARIGLEEKINAAQAFLDAHILEQQQYAEKVKFETTKLGMDEIQLLQLQYEEEKKQRKAEYKEQLKDLKKHLTEVKSEYRDKLKELKAEIKKEGLDKISIDIILKGSKSSSSTKKRAKGGSVSSGETYLVGEEGPELFTPNFSGKIASHPDTVSSLMAKIGGGGGNSTSTSTTEYNFDFSNANITDEASLIRKIQGTLNRQQELRRIGA